MPALDIYLEQIKYINIDNTIIINRRLGRTSDLYNYYLINIFHLLHHVNVKPKNVSAKCRNLNQWCRHGGADRCCSTPRNKIN